jgi:bifunctional oligoribonuclease and PAP phosphatase NrnA
MDEMEKKYEEAFEAIKKADNILVAGHNHPDGDAISCLCAVSELLNGLNKKHTLFCVDPVPKQYDFLPNSERILSDKKALDFSGFDMFITVDCGELNRSKIDKEVKDRGHGIFIIEIDHHPHVEDYADIELRQPEKTSTAEVLYNFLSFNRIKISKNIATCILAGILTDTGNLLYESTTEEAVNISSKMLLHGAKYPEIFENTLRNKSLSAMRIWGVALSRLVINPEHNFAYTVLTLKDVEECGATDEELEALPGFISNLEKVKGLLVLKEMEGSKIKGSLRSAYPGGNISKLARILGGGGHPRASGFVVDGKLEKTEKGWRVV